MFNFTPQFKLVIAVLVTAGLAAGVILTTNNEMNLEKRVNQLEMKQLIVTPMATVTPTPIESGITATPSATPTLAVRGVLRVPTAVPTK